jgi:hypothetical protein
MMIKDLRSTNAALEGESSYVKTAFEEGAAALKRSQDQLQALTEEYQKVASTHHNLVMTTRYSSFFFFVYFLRVPP